MQGSGCGLFVQVDLPKETEENHKNPSQDSHVSGPTFEPRTS
jgi:hypothetical protein